MMSKQRNLPLPVLSHKHEFLQAFKQNQTVLVVGKTGGGKTTQIPQFILEAVLDENPNPKGENWLVGCTQPCRAAALSVSRRVAEEMDVDIGEEVGYTIRSEDCTSPRTVLKYLTNGMLLREAMVDPLLSRYKAIVIDEAHERTLATDLLLGFLKIVLNNRPDLKLVVMMSATQETDKFQEYLCGAPLIKVPGGLHPVEIFYTLEPQENYLEAAIRTVVQIHKCQPPGDVLLFLPEEEEIVEACSRIARELGDQIEVVHALQQKIYNPRKDPAVRKIVVSTNIADTSLTTDEIVYVVDSGFFMQIWYIPRTQVESSLKSAISQASADQRAERAGRTRPGTCFRLYTEKSFYDLKKQSYPEILTSNLANAVLTLKKLGVNDLIHFNYMDPPAPETLCRALGDLFGLGALDDEGNLTKRGEMM